MFKTLVSVDGVKEHLGDGHFVIVDCRFDLSRPEAGREAYLASHVPGAVYARLDEDLSGLAGWSKGRHPLPSPQAMTALFSRLGIDETKQVVVYDSSEGSISARLWWMLRFMGHEGVALLDGGWPVWIRANLPHRSGEEGNAVALFEGQPRSDRLVRIEEIASPRLLVDSRDPSRYRGEHEPIDPVAGHIPGAVNHFWRENLDPSGRFLPQAQLRERFQRVTENTPTEEVVFYCGSGVTACHNIVAAVHSGLPEPRLYAGSWSEWCSDPGRPVATGA
ncbi:MAG: sulfurtransferase [Gammaproteobacteria bacterium]